MARSRWKLGFFSVYFWKKIVYIKYGYRFSKNRLYFDRSSNIPGCFLKKVINVHKGKKFRTVKVSFKQIGYKFGEFSFTRKPYHFPLKKSLKRKN